MRFDVHYDSDPHGEGRRSRWWAVLLFWLAVLTLVLGWGWIEILRADITPNDPVPTRTVIGQE